MSTGDKTVVESSAGGPSDPLMAARWQVRRLRTSLARLRAQLTDTQTYMDSVGKKLLHEAEDQIKANFRVFPIARFYRHLSDKHIAAIQRQKLSPSTANPETAHLFKNYDLSKFALRGPPKSSRDDGEGKHHAQGRGATSSERKSHHSEKEEGEMEGEGQGLIVVDDNNPPSELVEFLHYQLAENANLKEKHSTHRWQMAHMEHKVAAANNLAKEKSESLLRTHEVIKNYEGMLAEMRQKVHDLEFENISLRSKAEDMVREQLKARAQFQEEMQALRVELSSPKRKSTSASRRGSAFNFADEDSSSRTGLDDRSRRRSTITADSIVDTDPSELLGGLPAFMRKMSTVATQTDFVTCSTALPSPKSMRTASMVIGNTRRPSSCRASIVVPDPVVGNERGGTMRDSESDQVGATGDSTGDPAIGSDQERAENEKEEKAKMMSSSRGGSFLSVGPSGSMVVHQSFSASVLPTGRPGSAPVAAPPVVVQRLYKLHEDWATKWENKSDEIRRVDEALYQHSMAGHDDPSSHHVANPPQALVIKSPSQQRVSPPRATEPLFITTPPKPLALAAPDACSPPAALTSPRPPMSARAHGHVRTTLPTAVNKSPERLRLHNATYNYHKVFMITPAYEPALRVGVAASWESAQRKITSPKRR